MKPDPPLCALLAHGSRTPYSPDSGPHSRVLKLLAKQPLSPPHISALSSGGGWRSAPDPSCSNKRQAADSAKRCGQHPWASYTDTATDTRNGKVSDRTVVLNAQQQDSDTSSGLEHCSVREVTGPESWGGGRLLPPRHPVFTVRTLSTHPPPVTSRKHQVEISNILT